MEQNWEPRNKPTHIQSTNIWFDKGAKNTQWGKDSLFNKWCWETGYPHAKEWNWSPVLHHTQKLTQNELKSNIVTTTIYSRNSSLTLVLAMTFWIWPKAQATKAKVNKWNYIKQKSFCTAKETINKIKRQPTECEKIFANHISDRWLIPKIYKELIQLNSIKNKQTNNPI